jgi:hypothetical protein
MTRAAFGVLAGATLGWLLPASTTQATQGASVQAFMTLYGWVDNSPPGPLIAHPCLHPVAGGTGTYTDPITFATDVAESPWCQVVYVPYMRRYFIHEDECSECDHDWAKYGLHRFDMWAGGDKRSRRSPERRALLHCENTWTLGDYVSDPNNPDVIVDPQPGLPVTSAPIFSPPTACWNGQ